MDRVPALLLAAAGAVAAGGAGAQDLVIVDARILDGTGLAIERGSVSVVDGRIAAVAPGELPAVGTNVTVVAANGMTLLPGFIDAHRHIIGSDTAAWFRDDAAAELQAFLDAGFTTLMSGGGPVPGIVELERRIESGALTGPRIVTSGRADPERFASEEEARVAVRDLAAAGVSIVKARIDETQRDMLAAIVDEAAEHGLEVMVHAVTVPAMLAAIDAGAQKLVHTPHDSFLTPEQAGRVAAAGIENLSTVGFAAPVFGVFNETNVPTFRDGSPWPQGILGTGSNAAGEKMVNARTLWDAGVVYGFGTDTGYAPRDGLYHELKVLNVMFSPADLMKLMGPNTAAFVGLGDEIGTIEAGKRADLVLVEGDPRELIFELLDVRLTIKGGEIVADHR